MPAILLVSSPERNNILLREGIYNHFEQNFETKQNVNTRDKDLDRINL